MSLWGTRTLPKYQGSAIVVRWTTKSGCSDQCKILSDGIPIGMPSDIGFNLIHTVILEY